MDIRQGECWGLWGVIIGSNQKHSHVMFLKHLLDQIILNVNWLKSSLRPPICNICESSLVSMNLLKWGIQNGAPSDLVDWQLEDGDTIITHSPHAVNLLTLVWDKFMFRNRKLMLSSGQLTPAPSLSHTHTNACQVRLSWSCSVLADFTLPLLNFTSLVLAQGSFLTRTFEFWFWYLSRQLLHPDVHQWEIWSVCLPFSRPQSWWPDPLTQPPWLVLAEASPSFFMVSTPREAASRRWSTSRRPPSQKVSR